MMTKVTTAATTRRMWRGRSRRCMTMVLVIVCLIVITGLIGVMVRHVAMSSRQIRQRARHTQAMLLAESAIERAAFTLQSDPGFRTEVWQVSAEEIGGPHSGRVEVEVVPAEDSTVTVSVIAEYPDSTDFRARVSKSVKVKTNDKGE